MIAKIQKLAEKAFRASEEKSLDALAWYQYAGRFCAELDLDHGLPSGTVAGVVAALSPLNTWEAQIKFTPRIISNALILISRGRNPHPAISLSFFSNKDKAARILQGEKPLDVLGGDKVRAFYLNLTGDWSQVTIDRHAVNIAGWTGAKHDNRQGNKNYARIATAYKFAAESLGLAPAECQALTWCYWRNPW